MNEKVHNRPFYTKYAWAYDLLVPRPFKQRCDFIESIILDHGFDHTIKILDAGCGTGNYTIELARRGYQVTGIDLSQEQIAEAGKKISGEVHHPDFICTDLFRFNGTGIFDLILCRGVLNDIIEDESRDKILLRFNQLLKPHGLLIADVRHWVNSMNEIMKQPVSQREIETEFGLLQFESKKNLQKESRSYSLQETHRLIRNNHVIDEDRYDFVMRCWTEEELQTRLTNSGFFKIDCYGGFDKEISVGETVYIITIAQTTE